MTRPKLSAFGVVGEALGFATTKFGPALRLAWLPIVLLLVLEAFGVSQGWVEQQDSFAKALRLEPGYTFQLAQSLLTGAAWQIAAVAAVATVIQASMATALIRMAATGQAPHHRSAHISFGLREIKYIVACAASFAGVIFATRAALTAGYGLLNSSVVPVLNSERAVFTPGSLHSVATEPAYGSFTAFLAEIDAFYSRIGLDITAIQMPVLIPVSLIAGYLLLRLIPLPFFAAARNAGDGYSSLGAAWRLTGGMNIFPMLIIVVLLVLAHVFTLGMLWFGFIIFGFAVQGSEVLIAGLENFVPDGPIGPALRGTLTVISSLIVVFATTFMVAINAGLGGALVHRGASRG